MKKYNFVVDIGNSNIVFGVYLNGKQTLVWRCETAASGWEFYADNILKHFQANGIKQDDITKIAISSVVPALNEAFEYLITKVFCCPFVFVDAHTDLGLSFPMPDPGFIGSDLIVSSYAAWQKYQTNCLICDFGTATTFHLVSSKGFYFGSAIAPGIITAAGSLFEKAAQLFRIELARPENLLGTSTRDSMLSGLINGHLFMAEGFVRAIKQEYRHLPDILTIATGGIASLICANSQEIDVIDPNLVLDGLALICDQLKDNA